MKGIRLIDIDRITEPIPSSSTAKYAFAAAVFPRFIQFLRENGKTGLMLPNCELDPGEDLPELCILEDIDGSKVLCCRACLPIVNNADEIRDVFRAARKNAETAEYPIPLFYAETGLKADGGTAYLKGLTDADASVVFSDPDAYFAEIADGMIDLPLVRLDPHKKYDAPALMLAALPQPDYEETCFLPAENILFGHYVPYTVSAPNVRPILRTKIQMTEGRTVLGFMETEGKETACDVVCAGQDFSFRALFSPYELKVFAVDLKTGKVTETDLTDPDVTQNKI